jgi:hypothetical protein
LLRISGSPLKKEMMADEKDHLIKLPPSDAATRFVQHCERDDDADIREDTP